GQPCPLPVVPAGGTPPTPVVVAAGGDEPGVGRVGHRGGVEVERGHGDRVRRALVVQRPRLGGRAHGERPAGDQHLARQRQRVRGRRARRVRREDGRAGRLRRWWVMSIVSSCCCSCWAIMPNANALVSSRVPVNVAASTRSSTRPRTSWAYARASAGGSSGSVGRSARGCSNAS